MLLLAKINSNNGNKHSIFILQFDPLKHSTIILSCKMTYTPQFFSHEVFGEIRTMTNEKGETFFVGKDVARALGYNQADKAILRHVDDDDRTKHTVVDSRGRVQLTYIINESGLNSLILSSKLEQARAFKRWVTSEVLPQIRRTGGLHPHEGYGDGPRADV